MHEEDEVGVEQEGPLDIETGLVQGQGQHQQGQGQGQGQGQKEKEKEKDKSKRPSRDLGVLLGRVLAGGAGNVLDVTTGYYNGITASTTAANTTNTTMFTANGNSVAAGVTGGCDGGVGLTRASTGAIALGSRYGDGGGGGVGGGRPRSHRVSRGQMGLTATTKPPQPLSPSSLQQLPPHDLPPQPAASHQEEEGEGYQSGSSDDDEGPEPGPGRGPRASSGVLSMAGRGGRLLLEAWGFNPLLRDTTHHTTTKTTTNNNNISNRNDDDGSESGSESGSGNDVLDDVDDASDDDSDNDDDDNHNNSNNSNNNNDDVSTNPPDYVYRNHSPGKIAGASASPRPGAKGPVGVRQLDALLRPPPPPSNGDHIRANQSQHNNSYNHHNPLSSFAAREGFFSPLSPSSAPLHERILLTYPMTHPHII